MNESCVKFLFYYKTCLLNEFNFKYEMQIHQKCQIFSYNQFYVEKSY